MASKNSTTRWSTTSAAADCCAVWFCGPRTERPSKPPRGTPGSGHAAAPDVIRLAPPLIITEAQLDSFLPPPCPQSWTPRDGRLTILRHFLRDDDRPRPSRPRCCHWPPTEGGPGGPPSPGGGPRGRRGDLRQELHSHPVLLRDGHRPARQCRRGRRPLHPTGRDEKDTGQVPSLRQTRSCGARSTRAARQKWPPRQPFR